MNEIVLGTLMMELREGPMNVIKLCFWKVICSEWWVYHHSTEFMSQICQWKYPGHPIPHMAMVSWNAGKLTHPVL